MLGQAAGGWRGVKSTYKYGNGTVGGGYRRICERQERSSKFELSAALTENRRDVENRTMPGSTRELQETSYALAWCDTNGCI